MIHPFLENTAKTVQYTLLWLSYAVLQTLALYPLLNIPVWALALDGFVHAVIFGVLGILLWNVVKYANYTLLSPQQRVINYSALAILTLLIWLGLGFGLFYLAFDKAISQQLFAILPLRGLLGIVMYLLIIQQFRFSYQIAEPEFETPTLVENSNDKKQKKLNDNEPLERITVKSGTKIHVILVPNILFLQADGDYVQIVSTDGKYLKEQTMKYFEEHLPDNQFVRVHRSIIVNVQMISGIELYEKQNQLLTLKNGMQIKTSPAGYKALRLTLGL